MPCPIPRNEPQRLAALHELNIIAAPLDPGLDALCRMAKGLFDAPVAVITLVDEEEMILKVACGVETGSLPRESSLCAHTILSDQLLVVEDATCDARFLNSPLVTGDFGLRFYAGAPIALEPDLRIGTVCIVDTRPRRFSSVEREALRDLAEAVVSLFRLHKSRLEATREAETRRRSEQIIEAQRIELAERKAYLRTTLENINQGILMIDAAGVVQVYNNRVREVLALPESILAERPTLSQIVDFQFANGDFPGAGDGFVEMVKTAGLDGQPRTYERLRRDGRLVEVRVMPLAEGGSVRTYTDVSEARRVVRAMRDNEERLSLALDATRDGVWDIDLSTGNMTTSGNSFAAIDLPDSVARLEDLLAIIHPEDRSLFQAALADHIAGESELLCVEYRLRLKTGDYLWALHRGRVVTRDGAGRALRLLGTHTDISERKRTEEALHILNERLELALMASALGLWDWDLRDGRVWRCRRWHDILGLSEEAARDIDAWRERIHPEDRESVVRALQAHLRGSSCCFEHEYRLRHADGSYRWIAGRGRVVEWDNGRPVRILGVDSDITRRKEAERHAAHMARHDALTDLPNRLLLDERLEQALAHARRHGGEVGVLCLDLDRFKSVNDTLGHAAGDTVLVEVAGRLRDLVRTEDTVARLGGDEFAIIQVGSPDVLDCEALARRIVQALSHPIRLPERDVLIGTSIGIALAPRDGTNPRDLLVRADTALYRAKAARNTFRFFEACMDRAAAERRALELDLRKAVAASELVVHYQPIRDLATGMIVAREALVRWQHPERGLVAPSAFICVAEQIGMIAPIGRFVLERACADARHWPEGTRVAVNISPVQFRQHDFLEQVRSALEHAGLSPDRLELEITETALFEDGEATNETFDQVRALGVRLALDDFGTGYSSLGYLSRYMFDKIKIDRSFIREIDNEDNAAIVRAIVELGRRRGSDVVAEGIETQCQLQRVASLGCAQGQGYLLGRPEPLPASAPVGSRRSIPSACEASAAPNAPSLAHTTATSMA